MNYIKQLEQTNREQAEQLAAMKAELLDFRAFVLTSPKFLGTDTDGDRKDWIATGDVASRLEVILELAI
jgi:hypothetical protein